MRSFFILLLFIFFSCTQDNETVIVEKEVLVLPAKSDSTGITVGGGDFGFDDDDESPTTSIHNPTFD